MEISSSKPEIQRMAVYSMALHQRKKLMSASLAKALREELGARNIPVITGDKVQVMRGSAKGKNGKVARVNRGNQFVEVEGVTRKKSDGKEVPLRIHPSNLRITELVREDPKRFKHLKKKIKVAPKQEKAKLEEKAAKEEAKTETQKEAPQKEQPKAPKKKTGTVEKNEQ
ncbi:MAG TPA: 50S ribosomal protein L24 [archaeon]|nr:50S ribosomal protein L24 [archaeon]HLD81017.1 50S ribosomal protein L24 [archaeon]